MAGEAKHLTDDEQIGRVIPLGKDPPPEPRRLGSRARGLHGIAMGAAVLFSIVAAFAALMFITVRWPDDSGRTVMAVCLFALVGVVASVSTAVLTAAKATYVSSGSPEDDASGDTAPNDADGASRD